jgi:SAM-dependent methyltransferase
MKYSPEYDNLLLRGEEDARPWDLHEEIRKMSAPNQYLLDIGCGTASKTLALSETASLIVGLEINAEMRRVAVGNIRSKGIENVYLVGASAMYLPFPDEIFDLVTVMVAPHSTKEVARVLKRGGRVVVEKIGDRDKWNIKIPFGVDDEGPRGQFSDYSEGDRARHLEEEFNYHFGDVTVKNGFWGTRYTLEGLSLLLRETPVIRNYDPVQDVPVLDILAKTADSEGKIHTTQNRVLVLAEK